jgi:hypothetical protein
MHVKFIDSADVKKYLSVKIVKAEFTKKGTEILTKFITSLPYLIVAAELYLFEQEICLLEIESMAKRA